MSETDLICDRKEKGARRGSLSVPAKRGPEMGIVFGLLSALFWGSGDYLITQLTRRVGTRLALVYIQTVSLMAWLILLAVVPNNLMGGPRTWMIVVLTGFCHVLGLAFVYRAFQVGTLSLVSPISSSFAVVTALLALIAGERPPLLALAGAGLLFVGVVVATRSPSDEPKRGKSLKGIPEAIGSALAFGTMFWLFYFFVQPDLGYIWPLIVLKTMAAVSSIFALAYKRGKHKPPISGWTPLTVWLLAIAAAAADTLAWLAYIWGTSTEYATIVTGLASLFSVVTILLAWALLRERLAPNQWAGVAVILLGILLVSI